jgi:hypothetical protein
MRELYDRRIAWQDVVKKYPIVPATCPLCGDMLGEVRSGGGFPIGYHCTPCGFGGVGRSFTLRLTPALYGLNPCGIIEETWEYQIEQRKRHGIQSTESLRPEKARAETNGGPASPAV